MSATQDITFGLSSQTLVFDCPDGRPSAVTSVTVYEASSDDTSNAESATTGSASVETNPNTTVDITSGATADIGDPTLVYLTSTTGISVGRRYLLTSTLGHSEWVEVVHISSGDYVRVKQPLLNDYADSSTFVGTRCSITVDSTWVADTNNLSPTLSPNPRYRVRWLVVVGGVSQVYDEYFDLVRYPSRHRVTPLDVAARYPNWLDWLGPDSRMVQGRDLIDRAWRAVKFDLYADNKADQAIRNAEALDEIIITKVLQMSLEDRVLAGGTVDPDAISVSRDVYRQRYDQLLRSPVVAYDSGGGGAAAPINPGPLWKR